MPKPRRITLPLPTMDPADPQLKAWRLFWKCADCGNEQPPEANARNYGSPTKPRIICMSCVEAIRVKHEN